jgi:hypothetical protein
VTAANLDLVRSIYEDWERGDWSAQGWAHPEIEVVWADGPTPGKSTGAAGMAERTRDFLRPGRTSAFRRTSIEVDDERHYLAVADVE